MILLGTNVFPCTCAGPFRAKTMREAAEWYTKQANVGLIFEGKVIKQELHSGSVGAPSTAMSMTGTSQFRTVSFAVTRVLRGSEQDHVSVLTGLGSGDCGYDFQTGQTYLVYASTSPAGSWFTSICSGTNAIEDAGTALRFLAGEKPTAEDLLPPQEYAKQYIDKILPKRTGSVCGQVLKPDGTPLKGADVELWELRDDDLPSRSAEDPNTSTDDGRFCIEHADPGRYLLTAESSDYDHDARYMALYPGVNSRGQAIQIDISPGLSLPDVKFTTFNEPLYTIRIRLVTPDGTRLSYKNGCGVLVDSEYRDPLSYHVSHTLEDDGSYTFGYIPAGKYVITTYFQPNFEGGEVKPFPDVAKWKQARQEVIVRGDKEIVIQMEPVKTN
jgi:hypothetical protein